MIHGQAAIHAIRRSRIQYSCKPVAPLHETSMADIGGLRQACGSGGVHVEGSVFGSRQPALRLAQRFATILVEVAINAPERSVGMMVAMNPDCVRRRVIRGGSSQTIDQLCGSNHMPG